MTEGVSPQEMIGEFCEDNQQLTRVLRATTTASVQMDLPVRS